jgi:hypothetical protein
MATGQKPGSGMGRWSVTPVLATGLLQLGQKPVISAVQWKTGRNRGVMRWKGRDNCVHFYVMKYR